jgi:hypothetical protein
MLKGHVNLLEELPKMVNRSSAIQRNVWYPHTEHLMILLGIAILKAIFILKQKYQKVNI